MLANSPHPPKVVRTRCPSPAMVVACLALFSGLGGVGYAAATIGSAQIKNNSVLGKDIRNSTIKSGDIANGTVGLLDLDKAVNAKLSTPGTTGPAGPTGPVGPSGDVADGAITNAKLADNAVTSGKVADGTINEADVSANAVGAVEIQTDAVGATEIADSAIDSGEVENRGLTAVDVSKASGTVDIDFSSIAAGLCLTVQINASVPISGETVVVTPDNNWPLVGLTHHTRATALANFFGITACNTLEAPIDAPNTTFSYVVLDV